MVLRQTVQFGYSTEAVCVCLYLVYGARMKLGIALGRMK